MGRVNKKPDPEVRLESSSWGRRDFMKVCTMAAAAVGLPSWAAEQMAQTAASPKKPSVIWLHFQECTGCTESLLRTSHPDVADLILDLISLDYHETLFAAAGYQAEEALQKTMEENAGKFVLVVEGAIPTKENGIYCKVAGKTAVDMLNEVAAKAGAIIAIGSCASWGGIPPPIPTPRAPRARPRSSRARPWSPFRDAQPTLTTSWAWCFSTPPSAPCPRSTTKARPLFAYARVIHEDCPRRPHFDAGRFVGKFGDEGHKLGYCLYKTGARVRPPTPTARCCPSARCPAPGPSGSVTPAWGAPSRRWPSGCPSTRRWRSTGHASRHLRADARRPLQRGPRGDGRRAVSWAAPSSVQA